ncbi:MAG: MBL fold metallo-hydrolase [Lachnospiraceae bacterium]|nr:MBL fold metallo-hydrolase [Lachnospiraceae bacterium]
MTENRLQLTCFGARGSVSVSGEGFDIYGGGTSCYAVNFGKNRIFLDGGSGMVDPRTGDYSAEAAKEIVLITHMHLDHLIGLPYHDGLMKSGHGITIYVPFEAWIEKLDTLFSPPFWPLHLTDYAADLKIETVPEVIDMDGCRVTHVMGSHPGDSFIYRLDYEDSSIVYATDYEHDNGECDDRLVEFAHGADILIYDGSYTPDEYEMYRGYGHSTPHKGAELANRAGVKQLVITHHAPDHDDAFVKKMEHEIKTIFENSIFAYVGMVL